MGGTGTSRFRILERAGAGGMGDVFRAEDTSTGSIVALKRLRPGAWELARRFVRECATLAALSHPNIVRYVAHGIDDDGSPWLAMEWLEGEDLEKRLRGGRLPVNETLALGAVIAEALGAAHAVGIVHRDVKPSNVFLVGGDPRNLRLLDFGIAKPLHTAATAMTAAGSMLGTLGYLSPEQARGRELDARTDVFSLGCVVFECLTARPVFVAEHPIALLSKLLMERPAAPSEIDSSLAELDPLLAQLLAPVEQRAPDGRAAAALLRKWASAPLALASPTPAPSRPRLTEREQESFAVVLSRPPAFDPLALTGAADEAERDRARIEALVLDARGRHEWLPDGTLLCIWDVDVTRDQVILAARLAAAIRSDRATALATGFGQRDGSRAFGGVVDRAARLLSRGQPSAVIVDGPSAEILRRRFEITPDGDAFQLGSELEEAAAIIERSPFVGRTRELELLFDALDESARERTARAILVTGDAGSGKSRLLRELVRGRRGLRAWTARGDPMRPGSAYVMLAQLLRRATGLTSDVATPEAARTFAIAIRSLVEDDGSAAHFLAEAIGLGEADASETVRAARADPAVMAIQVRTAWLKLCAAVCTREPLVLVLEDLHWADAPSLRLIEAAVARLTDAPLFVLGAARPDFRALFPALWGGHLVQEVRLAGLSRKAAEQLASVLMADSSRAEIESAIDRAGGSPLWLEELFRYRHGPLDENAQSLLAMMQAHLAREPADERRVLRAAAIFGERAWPDGVGVLVGATMAAVEPIIARLLAKDWLVPTDEKRFPGYLEVAFRHGLLRDAAYASLTDEDRKIGHGLAARWLSQAGERDPIMMAEQLERSDDAAAAIPHYVEAAHRAKMANDIDAALRLSDRGFSLGATGSELLRLRLIKGQSLVWHGDVEASATLFENMLDQLSPNDVEAFEAVGWCAMVSAMQGDERTAMRAADVLEATELEHVAPAEYAVATSYVVSALYFGGQRERGDQIATRVTKAWEPADKRAIGWNHHTRMLTSRFSEGDTWQERCHLLKAIEAFESASDTIGTCHALGQLAVAELTLGAFERARVHAERSLDIANRFNVRLLRSLTIPMCAVAAAIAGDELGADRHLAAAAQLANTLGDEFWGGYARVLISYALRLQGKPERAIEAISHLAAEGKLLAVRAAAKMQLAGALLAAGRAAEAANECGHVVALSQPSRLHGALDLDFVATFAEALTGLGRTELRDTIVARGKKTVERRANAIDDLASRTDFLASRDVVRLFALGR